LEECYEEIVRRLEVREYDGRPVPDDVKLKVLDAGRTAPSSRNSQPWHFILVDGPGLLKRLSEFSFTGSYVGNASFAVVVLVDAGAERADLDGARAAQTMALAAWSLGVASRFYTGLEVVKVMDLLGIPADRWRILGVLSFGYPAKKLQGKEDEETPGGGGITQPVRHATLRVTSASSFYWNSSRIRS
jgi:nitroreductase